MGNIHTAEIDAIPPPRVSNAKFVVSPTGGMCPPAIASENVARPVYDVFNSRMRRCPAQIGRALTVLRLRPIWPS